MKAAVCYEYGKPMVIEDVDIDPPQENEVKVKVYACGVCHTDIHAIRGELFVPAPMVPGHEVGGYVDSVGKGVTSVKEGDPVVVSFVASCGKCLYCRTGRSHICEAKLPLDTECRIHNKKGDKLAPVLKVGGFAEYVVVHESQVVPMTEDMPLDRAALLGCGVITGVGAVTRRAKVEAMRSVVVVGTGGVGLNCVQGAAIAGAYPVIGVTRSDKKLAAARQFGATHTVRAGEPDTLDNIKKLTGGRGADYVFVTVGSNAAIEQAVPMAAPRGMIVIIGLPEKTQKMQLSAFDFLRPERMLTGSFMGSLNLFEDVPKLADLYQAGKLKLDELISNRYPLEEVNEAVESVERGEALRNVIML